MSLVTRPNLRPQDIATTSRLFEMMRDKAREIAAATAGALASVAIDGTPIEYGYGPNELFSPGSWPRIIWVPGSDSFGGPTMQSGLFGLPLKPHYTRIIGIVAYMHGQDTDMAEMMATDYACLLHKIFGATVSIQGGGLVDGADEDTDTTWLKDGAAYRLAFGIAVPVAPIANYAALRDVRLYNCQDTEVG